MVPALGKLAGLGVDAAPALEPATFETGLVAVAAPPASAPDGVEPPVPPLAAALGGRG
jgi:hypothetical protein